MKKSLIALAVMAASGAAMAQSTVTLYGWLDTYLASYTTENKGNVAVASVAQTKLDAGSVNGNRWGMKGSEDLGGGLKANFDLQSGFSQDTGAAGQGGLLFGRQAWVGFSGGFGAVRLGRTSLPFYDTEGNDDVMMNSGLSAQSNVFRTANGYNSSFFGGNAIVIRGNNTIRYNTPTIAGFTGALSYSLDEKTAPVAATAGGWNTSLATGIQVTSASLVYAAGPAGVTLAYQTEKPYLTTLPVGTSSDRNFFRLSGQYDFGTIIAKAGYGKAKNVEYVDGANTSEYQIGLDYKATPALLLSGGIARSTDDALGATLEVKRSAFTLGGKYSLSKRTFLYGGYEAGKATKSGAVDAKESLLALGVNHIF